MRCGIYRRKQLPPTRVLNGQQANMRSTSEWQEFSGDAKHANQEHAPKEKAFLPTKGVFKRILKAKDLRTQGVPIRDEPKLYQLPLSTCEPHRTYQGRVPIRARSYRRVRARLWLQVCSRRSQPRPKVSKPKDQVIWNRRLQPT